MNTTHSAQAYYLHPDSAPYRQGIFDVIRIFDPHFAWSESSEEGDTISVICGDTAWALQIGTDTISFDTHNLDENQCRKKLKQTVYQYFAAQNEADSIHQHPWGIMTGIRPTKIVHRYRDTVMHEHEMQEQEIKKTIMDEYFLREDKADLLMEVTARQRPFLLTPEEAKQSVSIYLSIPFCPTRCHYCSFPSFCLPKPHLQEEYLSHLIAECNAVGEALSRKGITVQTVYIGGGTPTSLHAMQLDRLLGNVQNAFGSHLAEFTVEAGRPDTITLEKLQLLHDYNVGRISINPQTFSQATLDAIGRRHTVQDLYDVYHMARGVGFDSINMDLIAGLTGETVEDFRNSLNQISVLKPENVTVHTLAIKRTAKLDRADFDDAQGHIVSAMNDTLQQWLRTEDYVPYYLYRQKQMIGDMENTGYALPGKESLYNIQMMEERQTIFGLGVGSTTKYVNANDWTLTQTNNPKDLFFYNQRIDEIIQKKIMMIENM